MNLRLKRGLIIQSMGPLFLLLIIRHCHVIKYRDLMGKFVSRLQISPYNTVCQTINHPMFGELVIFCVSIILVILAFIYGCGFRTTHTCGFTSKGEKVTSIEEYKDAAASFLMTFILPLLIDDLSTPQMWISYILILVVVYAVLYKSDLYYQSPVLALLGYRVFKFKVLNPDEKVPYGFKRDKDYIGITYGKMITDGATIKWKNIADDVYQVLYEENEK